MKPSTNQVSGQKIRKRRAREQPKPTTNAVAESASQPQRDESENTNLDTGMEDVDNQPQCTSDAADLKVTGQISAEPGSSMACDSAIPNGEENMLPRHATPGNGDASDAEDAPAEDVGPDVDDPQCPYPADFGPSNSTSNNGDVSDAEDAPAEDLDSDIEDSQRPELSPALLSKDLQCIKTHKPVGNQITGQISDEPGDFAIPDGGEKSLPQDTTPSNADVGDAEDAPAEDLGSDAEGSQCSDLADVGLAEHLQCIETHKLVGNEVSGHIEFLCLLRSGEKRWICESTVQKACNAAACTYWEQESEPRPKVPDQLLNILHRGRESGQWRVQMVGDPVFDLKAIGEALEEEKRENGLSLNIEEVYMSEVDENWPNEDERCHKLSATSSTRSSQLENDLQLIFSHRINGPGKFDFYCWWTSRGDWASEEDIQSIHNAAVRTYWQSYPGLRDVQAHELTTGRLKIVSHERLEEELYLTLRVGESVTVKKATELREMEYWKPKVKSYLKKHKLVI